MLLELKEELKQLVMEQFAKNTLESKDINLLVTMADVEEVRSSRQSNPFMRDSIEIPNTPERKESTDQDSQKEVNQDSVRISKVTQSLGGTIRELERQNDN